MLELMLWYVIIFTVSLVVINVYFAIKDAASFREFREISRKYTAVYAMLYLLERLHKRRFEKTREELAKSMSNYRLGRRRP